MVDLSVKIGSVTLKNPIMPASGSFSTEFAQVIDLNRLGALITKTVSRNYRAGNPPPRAAEVEAGMINCIGLPTKGLKYFLDEQIADYKRFTPPLVASITAEDAEDFATPDPERDAVDSDRRTVRLTQIGDLNDGIGCRCHGHSVLSTGHRPHRATARSGINRSMDPLINPGLTEDGLQGMANASRAW